MIRETELFFQHFTLSWKEVVDRRSHAALRAGEANEEGMTHHAVRRREEGRRDGLHA